MHSVIKTRMQSLEARQAYKNAFHCAYRIYTEEGLRRFWTGTTPRLARLVVRTIASRRGLQLTALMRDIAQRWHRVHGIREHHQGHRGTGGMSKCRCTLAMHPFHVLSLCCMIIATTAS